MKPLFTIHAGEYLVGSYIEKNFRRINLWVPSRDTGVDLLVSDRQNRHAVSIQVKFSKDYLHTQRAPLFQKKLRAGGWWTIDRDKLRNSPADIWVFVLLGFAAQTADFVIIPTRELWHRLHSIHGSHKHKMIQSYLCVTQQNRCWETRGLNHEELHKIAEGEYREPKRDLTKWLNVWSPLTRLDRGQAGWPSGARPHGVSLRQFLT